MSKKWMSLSLVLIFLLGACRTTDSSLISEKELHDFESAPLFGMIYQMDHQPCSGVTVSLLKKDKDSVILESQTDLNGRFILTPVPKGLNRILLTKEGYEPLEVNFDFMASTQIFYSQVCGVNDLINMAKSGIDEQDWAEVLALLERAEMIDHDSDIICLLKAVYFGGIGDEALAQRYLSKLDYLPQEAES